MKTLTLFLIAFSFSNFAFSQSSNSKPNGKAFNPDITANFLGLAQKGTGLSNSRTSVPRNGLSLKEAELQFTSDVDVYFRAVSLLSFSQESGTEKFGVSPEEVYLETISLPSLTLKAGKFKIALGKHNQLHTHAFPFIDAPLIHQNLLGDEGLNEVGFSSAILLPASWYSEVTLQGFTLENESLYKSASSSELGGLIRLKNLWDLSEDLTMELGLSATAGKNQFALQSSVFGSDLTFKWRPSEGGKYSSVAWSTEYLQGKRSGLTDLNTSELTENLGGLATWVQYQFSERWWIQGRYEYSGLPKSDALVFQNKSSALIGFFPSEFSGLRFQFSNQFTQGREKSDQTYAFQYNISIGAHPAHAY